MEYDTKYNNLKKKIIATYPGIAEFTERAEEHGEITFAEGVLKLLKKHEGDYSALIDGLGEFIKERKAHYHE